MRQDGIQEIVDAWVTPGPKPEYHKAAQERLRIEWPTLARALDNLNEGTAVNQERKALKRAYPDSKSWSDKVDNMRPDQVSETYSRLRAKRHPLVL